MTPQETATKVGEGMLASDHASIAMGIRLTHISPGAAHMEMVVRPNMVNGFGTCHGGMITTLADSAFGFACNSYNELSVASGFHHQNMRNMLHVSNGDGNYRETGQLARP